MMCSRLHGKAKIEGERYMALFSNVELQVRYADFENDSYHIHANATIIDKQN